MKKAVLQLVLPGLLFILPQACNQPGGNSGQAHTHPQAETHDESHAHESMASVNLTLNHGAKWKADEPTNKNAEILIAAGGRFSKNPNGTLEDYQAFGREIHSGINTMIRECTMEGDADKALHLWFLPLLEQTGTLKDATDTTGLSLVTSEMIHRLGVYKDYFE